MQEYWVGRKDLIKVENSYYASSETDILTAYYETIRNSAQICCLFLTEARFPSFIDYGLTYKQSILWKMLRLYVKRYPRVSTFGD